jgi:microcystin-dependent protein
MAIVLDGTSGIDTPAINAGNIVGEVCFFGMSTAPTGFLKANGAAVSRTTYAALFTAIGTTYGVGDGSTTFNLPDLRGEFPRGWDDGRGVDSGRAFGTAQDGNVGEHTHTTRVRYYDGTGSASGTDTEIRSRSISGSNTANTNTVTNGNPSGETRPRNVALLACIKF